MTKTEENSPVHLKDFLHEMLEKSYEYVEYAYNEMSRIDNFALSIINKTDKSLMNEYLPRYKELQKTIDEYAKSLSSMTKKDIECLIERIDDASEYELKLNKAAREYMGYIAKNIVRRDE